MQRPRLTCVKCAAALKPKDIVAAGPFPCPVCQTQLQVPGFYTQLIAWGSVIIPALVLAVLGLRGVRLLCGVLVAFVPILYVATNFTKYLVRPRLELYLPEDATLRLRDGPR
jgi:hypothetical protein